MVTTAFPCEDRSLISVAALVAMHRADQLRGHLERGLGIGVTREEIGEVGPGAMTAARVANAVFDER